MTVARDYLGMKVEEREVLFSEVPLLSAACAALPP